LTTSRKERESVEQEDIRLVQLLETEYKRLKTFLVGHLDHHLGMMIRCVETEGFREVVVTYKSLGDRECLYPNIMVSLGDVLKAYYTLDLLKIRLEILSHQILTHVFHTIVRNPHGCLEIKSSKSSASLILTFDTTTNQKRTVSVGKPEKWEREMRFKDSIVIYIATFKETWWIISVQHSFS
jgi:hypothetical protein